MNKFLVVFAALIASTSSFADDTCLFGEDIGSLKEISRLKVKRDILKTFKIARTGGLSQGKLVMVSVSKIYDKESKREFQMNTTFRHVDDGDNTWGWIEEVTGSAKEDSGVDGEGAVVAEIGDSSIDACKVQK